MHTNAQDYNFDTFQGLFCSLLLIPAHIGAQSIFVEQIPQSAQSTLYNL